MLLLKNSLVYYQKKIQILDVLIDDGKIKQIAKNLNLNSYEEVEIIECKDCLICPPFIDGHVHTRNPGLEHKETIAHFAKACWKAGISDVIAMGNVIPSPSTKKTYLEVNKFLVNDYVKIHQCCNITLDLNGKNLVNFLELSKYTNLFTDDGKPIISEEIMNRALIAAKNNNALLLLHEETVEDQPIHAYFYESEFTKSNQLPFLNENYEANIVKRDINLNQNINAHIHIQHISTAKTMKYIKEAKQKNMKITCEITPHHLLLSTNNFNKQFNPNFKMNPPLGKEEWRIELIQAFNDGWIDAIVSDHAPHTIQEKNNNYIKSPFGIIGVQWIFSLLYTHLVKKNIISLESLVEHLTNKPSLTFFNKKREININDKANLIIIDLSKKQLINENTSKSLAQNTPFFNTIIYGIAKWRLIGDKLEKI